MGLEAYRIKFETVNSANRAEILDAFTNIGFSTSSENFSDLYLEKAYDWGFTEVALLNSELHRIAMNEYVKQNNHSELIDIKPLDYTEKINIQIAKPNHENIIDCLMADAKEFNKIIPINVINLQSRKKVDLNDYGNLKQHYINARNEFRQYYPKPSYPIRCRDVFKSID